MIVTFTVTGHTVNNSSITKHETFAQLMQKRTSTYRCVSNDPSGGEGEGFLPQKKQIKL